MHDKKRHLADSKKQIPDIYNFKNIYVTVQTQI